MTSNVKVNQISIFLDILCIVIYLYHINAGTCLLKRLPWLQSWLIWPHMGLFHFQKTWIIYLKVLLFCYQIYLHCVHCDLCVCDSAFLSYLAGVCWWSPSVSYPWLLTWYPRNANNPLCICHLGSSFLLPILSSVLAQK